MLSREDGRRGTDAPVRVVLEGLEQAREGKLSEGPDGDAAFEFAEKIED